MGGDVGGDANCVLNVKALVVNERDEVQSQGNSAARIVTASKDASPVSCGSVPFATLTTVKEVLGDMSGLYSVIKVSKSDFCVFHYMTIVLKRLLIPKKTHTRAQLDCKADTPRLLED